MLVEKEEINEKIAGKIRGRKIFNGSGLYTCT